MTQPDFAGYIRAARLWETLGSGWRLQSVARGLVWKPCERVEAECLPIMRTRWIPPHHRSPARGCQCGVWGLASAPLLLRAYSPHPGRVYGIAALWGTVEVGQFGWRAQYAYPHAFVDVNGGANRVRLNRLADLYRIPVLDTWPPLTTIEPNPVGTVVLPEGD